MPSTPEPTTTFELFGQAIYAQDAVANIPSGAIVIFAVSEASHKWLGWYQFSSTKAPDALLLHAGHAVIAEGYSRSTHFKADKPFTVEELTGPIAYNRGGGGTFSPRFSSATLKGNGDTIDVTISVQNSNVQGPVIRGGLRLHFKGPYGQFSTFGYTIFLMSEPFSYPSPHLNVRERLRNLRRRTFA